MMPCSHFLFIVIVTAIEYSLKEKYCKLPLKGHSLHGKILETYPDSFVVA